MLIINIFLIFRVNYRYLGVNCLFSSFAAITSQGKIIRKMYQFPQSLNLGCIRRNGLGHIRHFRAVMPKNRASTLIFSLISAIPAKYNKHTPFGEGIYYFCWCKAK